MKKFDINEDPHRRFNPLINEWVLVSPHRATRPWQGQNEKIHTDTLPEYDATLDREISTAILQTKDNEEIELNEEGDEESQSVIDNKLL